MILCWQWLKYKAWRKIARSLHANRIYNRLMNFQDIIMNFMYVDMLSWLCDGNCSYAIFRRFEVTIKLGDL